MAVIGPEASSRLPDEVQDEARLGNMRQRGAFAVLALGALLGAGWLAVVLAFPSEEPTRYRTPEAALIESLGPGGWLGSSRSTGVRLLVLLKTPEGRVGVATNTEGALILADAKPDGDRWWAHGMFGLGRRRDAACHHVPTSGTTVTLAAGPLQHRAASIVVVDGDGTALVGTADTGFWIAAVPRETMFARVLQLDAAGAVVASEPVGPCGWPPG